MKILRWVGLIVLLAAAAAGTMVPLVANETPTLTLGDMLSYGVPVWYLAAGLVVMAKRPWHQVGWLLVLLGFGFTTTSLPVPASRLDPGWYPWLAWIGVWGGKFTYAVMAGLLAAFPDGLALRGERDRRIGRRIIVAMGGLVVLSALSSPVETTGASGEVSSFSNPLVRLVPTVVSDLAYIPVFLSLLGCVVWLWRRQRNVEGEERRRYTVILYSFSLLVGSLVFGISMVSFIGNNAWWGAVVGWTGLPVAFANAVTRHGLYGVDPLVRRTVSYGLVAMVVAVVYVTPVLLLPRLLGESNDLVVAASTLAAAAVFNPARRCIQSAVDRRFDRAHYDAEQEVEDIAGRLEGSIDLDTVTGDLAGVLDRTLAPTFTAVWLKAP